MILAISLAVIIAGFAAVLAGPDADSTPPIGWFFVVFMGELVGMVLGSVA